MTEELKKPVGIAHSLVAAMAEIDAVTKEGKNQAQGYAYVRAADVANEVRKVLVKHNIAFGFDVVEEERWMTDRFDRQGTVIGHMNYVRIVAEVEFEDAVTGQKKIRKGRGWGQDVGEKAIYKAMTGALKYALRMNFIIPDESDPENEERTTPAEATSAVLHKPPQAPANPQPASTPTEKAQARVIAMQAQQQADQGHFAEYEDRVECIVRGVSKKEAKSGKTYLLVTMNGRVNGFNYGFIWDTKLHEAIANVAGGVDKAFTFKFSKSMSDDGKSVKGLKFDDIIAIDGVQYKNGKPDDLLSQLTEFKAEDADVPF